MKNEMELKNKKVYTHTFTIIMLSISILFGLLTIQNEAVNETNQTNSGNNTTQTSSNNTTNNSKNTSNETIQNTNATKNTTNTDNSTNTNHTTTTKSSNANLSNLGIKPHDFTGFKSGTISYKAVIPEDTETIEVYAKTQDAKATVTGTGKKTLESGENKLEVVVTAEDGTKKTYTINITRGTQKESDENAEESENTDGLSALKINDLDLSPKFKTGIYEYTAKYIGESTKLNIETIPTSEDYNIEIIGNEDLQEGENIITILVSEKNGDNVATYQITINKSLVDEEAMAREDAEKQAKQQRTIMGIVVAVILMAIVVWIVVKRKNKNIAEEYSEVSLYAKNHNDEKEEEEQELPKALKEEKLEEASDCQEEEKNNEEKPDKEEQKNNKEDLKYQEDEIENMPKEKVKEEFLDHYSNYEEEYDAESKGKKKKEKRKGKRFKE